jgi:hypothetical protein
MSVNSQVHSNSQNKHLAPPLSRRLYLDFHGVSSSVSVMTTLYCNKCGERTLESEEYACACGQHLEGQRLPVSEYELTIKVRDKVVNYLSNMHPLSDNVEDVHIAGDMLAQVNDRANSVAEVASEELSAALLQALKDSVADVDKVPIGHKKNFNTRPWGLAASNMTSQSYFNECFVGESKLVDCGSNPESRCIDKLLNDHFHELNGTSETREALQEYNGIQLFEKFYAPVHALPDAVWKHEDQEYVLEIKTVSNVHSMLRYKKLKDWLYQVACYQLPSYQQVADLNNNGTPLPADTRKYLLAVILLNNTGSKLIVLEAMPANVARCSAEWLQWFENIPRPLEMPKPTKSGKAAKAEKSEDKVMQPVTVVKDLNKYFLKQTPFGKLKYVAKEFEFKQYKKQQEAEGWTVVGV